MVNETTDTVECSRKVCKLCHLWIFCLHFNRWL